MEELSLGKSSAPVFLVANEDLPVNRAQRALDSVQSSPAEALSWAKGLLEDPLATVEERASASWALGRAYSELDRIDEACTALEDGLKLAADSGLDELAAEIGASLSVCRLTAGDTSEARRLLASAEGGLVKGASKGRLWMQQGLIDLHLGDLDAAIAHFDRAEKALAAGVDDLARMRLLVNRGVVHTMKGDYGEAERDLTEGQALATASGQTMVSAGAAQNLGFVAGRQGEVPKALSWFNQARAGYESVGSPRRAIGILESDLCAVLLTGGLYAEAARAAEGARAIAAQGGNRLTEAEAMLLLARVRLAAGAPDEAEQHALRAAEIFRDSQREVWAAASDYVALQAAASQATRPNEGLLQRAKEIAEELLVGGWRRDALDVRTFAGRSALALGQIDEARAQLSTAAEARDAGSSAIRANAWLAAALLHLADGKRDSALAALGEGMEIVETQRSSFGSTELRAHASINGAELVAVGLRLADEAGDAAEVFAWAERWHASGVHLAPVRPEPGSRLARALTELREAHASAIDGTADPFEEDTDDTIAQLEREVRNLSREADGASADGDSGQGSGRRSAQGRFDLDSLQRRLGDDTLVEYFTIGTDLHAVVVTADRVTTHPLGPLSDVAGDAVGAASILSRLAFGSSAAASRAATTALESTGRSLDDRLIDRLGRGLGDGGNGGNGGNGELIIVPTGPLQTLPWPILPSLRDRAVTIAPSAELWATSELAHRPTEARPRHRVLLVCGPDVPGGDREVAQLAELYDDPTVLVGSDATVPRVLRAMEEADLVHVAAHGVFRADNPMFSSVQLHGGPLTVYDIETLTRAPGTVVLPACDAGRSSVRDGDELLGTASALLQVGVGTVIAPVTVVPDAAVGALMIHLHRRLQLGDTPALALTEARRLAASSGATAASFVAIGGCRREALT